MMVNKILPAFRRVESVRACMSDEVLRAHRDMADFVVEDALETTGG